MSTENKLNRCSFCDNHKDNVKKLGCKWDPEKKSWYYMSNTDKNKISEIMKLTT